ncbi:glycosyltransferase family 2 protein [Tumebacillus sp. ITR2]|uniref:Glucosyl-3-phosphoglycerate synthase n=1 Tax=Tumebacillus amylolyticus TaxID=2801339 RepID=A0ABS1JB66_9BACL|nr:glycosyltransferase family 2 protein [Tumebacillus amylolyticus]MBL0387517.1 glycosyltransferase family 2 protein [Tumebacillus amylolyticus]
MNGYPKIERYRKKVAVLIPAWNEGDIIDRTILAVRTLDAVTEIIVIDDCSTDETYRISLESGARVVRHRNNHGKGAALYSGILSTDAEIVVFLDADMGETAVEIEKLLRPVLEDRCDMTIGRLPSPLRGGFGLVKGFARRGIKHLSGVELQAPLSGQRVLNRRVLDAIGRLGNGYGVEVAMTIDAARKGMRLLEVEVDMKNREYGRDLRGFLHRGKQLLQIARVLLNRWQMR